MRNAKQRSKNNPTCSNRGEKLNSDQSNNFSFVYKKALRGIKYASYAGFVATGITAIFAFITDLSSIADALLLAFLSWGILKHRSRGSAISLLIYYLFSKIFHFFGMTPIAPYSLISSLFFIIAFISFFSLGISGTFKIHKIYRTKIIPKHVRNKLLISFGYGIITFCVFVVLTIFLYRTYPHLSDDIVGLIIIAPVEVIVFLSLIGVLPFSKKYHMVDWRNE